MNPQGLLAPLQAPYALALAIKNLGYDRGWFPARELAWPVISIGNLSVGGAGKTPVAIALANLLGACGVHADVLSRGYGRRSPQPVERVDPDGDANRFGDEPVLIANATQAPVYVGGSRWAAGSLAERDPQTARGIHLLDDGFGHRKLARTVDIVVVHPVDIIARLLPAGRLREPLRSLRRADFLILREDDTESEAALESAELRKPVWRVRRSLAAPALEGSAVAFCGIAHPGEFFASLRAHGISLRDTLAFRDHHAFTESDLRSISRRATGAGALLTTEKDFVRLTSTAQRQLSLTAPLLPVPLRAEILEAGRCVSALLDLVAERRAPVHRRTFMRK